MDTNIVNIDKKLEKKYIYIYSKFKWVGNGLKPFPTNK